MKTYIRSTLIKILFYSFCYLVLSPIETLYGGGGMVFKRVSSRLWRHGNTCRSPHPNRIHSNGNTGLHEVRMQSPLLNIIKINWVIFFFKTLNINLLQMSRVNDNICHFLSKGTQKQSKTSKCARTHRYPHGWHSDSGVGGKTLEVRPSGWWRHQGQTLVREGTQRVRGKSHAMSSLNKSFAKCTSTHSNAHA